MSLSQTILDRVKPYPKGSLLGGSNRTGTAYCTLNKLEELFGECHALGDLEKTSKEWHFETPRGRVTLRDYWWNKPAEQSIASIDGRAALWIGALLRRYGVKADRKTHRG